MSTQADLGKKALDAKDYPAAIKHLTSALTQSQSPVWYIQRSTAYQRAKEYELALEDADNALLAAINRARRELIATAQFRRALALHSLKRFGDARMCLNWCKKSNEKEPGLTLWMGLVKKDYEEAGGEDGEANNITVKEIPKKTAEPKAESKAKPVAESKGKGKEVEKTQPVSVKTTQQQPTPSHKIRHEYFQSGKSINLDILVAGVDKNTVDVKFEERSVEISFPVVDSASIFDFTLSPLYGSIIPEQSSYRITPRKIEVILAKKDSTKWKDLEWKEGLNPLEPNPPTTETETVAPIPDEVKQHKPVVEVTPVYPTSSRTGPKNWDKILGDAKDDEEENDPDFFFKKLYKGADDDTKKAMMKSMQESGGTSLSTVWSDVSSKTFKPVPPEGMEAKQYEK